MAVFTRDHVVGGSAVGYFPVPSPRQPKVGSAAAELAVTIKEDPHARARMHTHSSLFIRTSVMTGASPQVRIVGESLRNIVHLA